MDVQRGIASAWLLISVLGYALSAQAEPVSLYCQNEHPANNMRIEVDYSTSRIAWGHPSMPSELATTARINEYEITWNGVGSARGIGYRIDRINGEFRACDKDGCWPNSLCTKADTVKPKF